VAGLEPLGLTAQPSPFRRSTMACTGLEFCKLAIVDTKNRARDLVAELERRFPDHDVLQLAIARNGAGPV
jgi:sulfite reductase (ferredoxin)